MHKSVFNLVVVCLAVVIIGCASRPITQQPVAPAAEPNEKLIWSTHEQRPGWTVSEPETVGEELAFVGLSDKYATEKESRDDAMRTATNNVVKYIGTLAQDKFNRLQTSYGLTTQIVDPTNVTRRLEEQLASAFATRIKAKEWYIEKWQRKKTKDTYILAFVLSKVPKTSVDEAYEEVLNNTIDDLKKKRDEASEEQAKSQFENAMKAFEDAKQQGFSLEEKE
ncbi:MAG: hypothetical protein AUJ85_00015 [Elusimicrobia bacterium CG1_02_37_114]|nr:MAG: hypothetical protein AUJ85_00015 [Elusimicrobia bacterium CG1_02_37_114]PIV52917.1 MAG: hypothetical protein COS17_06705 [Elusimicrobia bacterium CG02_land_8_20_14_3_00_37_13]PIZ13266.1 MAG: hypothetical protein COY53_05765 [Elusimicrobia bacterium CG_4_10_14_0_8_um_filter_37_32]